MKKIYTYFLMVIAIIALSFILLMLSPWFIIENIEVNGISKIEKTDIIRELRLDKKTNILNFNSFIAKRRLKNNYYVENVKVSKKFPNTVKITISERDIVGYILYINDYIYIDKDGLVIDIKPNYKEKLPIVYGLDFNNFIIGKKIKTTNNNAFNIVMEITRHIKNSEKLKDIIKIDISNLEDIHLYTDKIDIILGNNEAINIKMNILNEILKKFQPEEKGVLYLDDVNRSPIFKYIT